MRLSLRNVALQSAANSRTVIASHKIRSGLYAEAPPVSGELQVNYGAPTCINTEKKTYLRNTKELQGTWIDRGQHQ